MSWSSTETWLKAGDELSLVNATGVAEPVDEVRAQVSEAREAALAIVRSGAVGGDGTYRCLLSGHANEGHEPKQGWANDMVAVNVSQVELAAAEGDA